jgi:hypothetical protein
MSDAKESLGGNMQDDFRNAPVRCCGVESKKHMTYNDKQFLEMIQKTVKDLNTEAYTQARVCSTASIRCVRDWLLAAMMSKDGKPFFKGETAKDVHAFLTDEFKELIGEVSKSTESGFASNASAAAKAAGFKSTSESLQGLVNG